MNELKVLNEQKAIIDFNFDVIKTEVSALVNQYKNIIVTEDTLKQAKEDQKLLGRLRLDIEDFRKKKKKEFEAPIKEFESKCKELISIIGEAELPLKDGIDVFDDKRREEKRKKAEEWIQKAITDFNLNDTYSAMLVVKDSYMNLSDTQKSVKEDIIAEATKLKSMQDTEEANKKMISDLVNSFNGDMISDLKVDDFYRMLSNGVDITEIVNAIKERAVELKDAEEKAKKAASETVVDTPPIIAPVANNNVSQSNPVTPILNNTIPVAPQIPNMITNIPSFVNPVSEKWEITLKLTGSREEMALFRKFLDDNKILYQALAQNRIA